MTHYVYKIWSNKGNKVYYGSTCAKRDQRFINHKSHYRNGRSSCSSKILFDEYGVENCFFEVVEECKDVEELRLREKWYIQNNDCVNQQTPSITEEERKEKKKQYTIEHRDEKKEYDHLRRMNDEERYKKITCECGGKYVIRHKTTHEKTKRHMEYAKE